MCYGEKLLKAGVFFFFYLNVTNHAYTSTALSKCLWSLGSINMDTVQMFPLYLKHLKLNDFIESLELLPLVCLLFSLWWFLNLNCIMTEIRGQIFWILYYSILWCTCWRYCHTGFYFENLALALQIVSNSWSHHIPGFNI